jgi:hypothetical protein
MADDVKNEAKISTGPTGQRQPASILPKITVKDVGADPKSIFGVSEDGDMKARSPLMRVYGVAQRIKDKKLTNTVTGEVNTYEALSGEFRAVNLKSGSRFQSGLLYLPEGIHDLIANPLKSARENNETAEVTFAMDIYSRRTTSAAGYGYGAVVLGEPTVPDEIAVIERAIEQTPGGAPALPNPDADTTNGGAAGDKVKS